MGLRQTFKGYKYLMTVVATIVVTNILAQPFALAAQISLAGQCELNTSAIAAGSDDVNSSDYDVYKPVAKKKTDSKTKVVAKAKPVAKKADFKAASLKKSSWQPIGMDYNLDNTEVNHGYHPMTAYTSEVAQTDASPCTTANGYNVCKSGVEDTIAANFLPFGTKVKIPELFGDRVFTVRDRMNSRYTSRVDVWMKDKSDALQFGIRNARIVVLK